MNCTGDISGHSYGGFLFFPAGVPFSNTGYYQRLQLWLALYHEIGSEPYPSSQKVAARFPPKDLFPSVLLIIIRTSENLPQPLRERKSSLDGLTFYSLLFTNLCAKRRGYVDAVDRGSLLSLVRRSRDLVILLIKVIPDAAYLMDLRLYRQS